MISFQHAIVLVKIAISYMIPDIPGDIKKQLATMQYKKKQLLKVLNTPVRFKLDLDSLKIVYAGRKIELEFSYPFNTYIYVMVIRMWIFKQQN